jgi:hypothetical protein
MLSKVLAFSIRRFYHGWVYHHCEGITSWHKLTGLCFTETAVPRSAAITRSSHRYCKEFSGARFQRHCIIHHIHDTAFLCRVQSTMTFGWWQPQDEPQFPGLFGPAEVSRILPYARWCASGIV